MTAKTSEPNYYYARKDRYWKQLGRLFRSSTKILPHYVGVEQVQGIHQETRRGFENLLTRLPDIGGDENILTFTFVSSAAALAYMRVLEAHGLSVETIGKLLNEVYEDVFTCLPGFLKWHMSWKEFSPRNQKVLKEFAADSQLRQYPGNWVVTYVEGSGADYDFGLDYTKCAVLKFYREMGAERFMPYICVMDFTMSRALRTGLYRTQSLCFGGDYCDFRFRKNQLGLPPLPLEDLPEHKNRK